MPATSDVFLPKAHGHQPMQKPIDTKTLLLRIVFVYLTLVFSPSLKSEQALRLGVHPYLPATELLQRFTPMADFLAQQIGRKIVIRIARDYQEHIDQVGQDALDVAYLGPAPYVMVVDKYGVKPLLGRLEVNGKPFFRGAIVIRHDSPLNRLEDLKGQRFAFGDRYSTMSHLVPRHVMWKAAVSVENLASFEYLNSHHNVALGVLMGDFDAGAVKEEVLEHYQAKGLRSLAMTPPISEHLFVGATSLPDSTLNHLRHSLYALAEHNAGLEIIKAIKSSATAIVPVSDADYDNLREILKTKRQMGVRF